MLNWDDIRIFLVAARAGSLAIASQKLGIDSATVGRRLTRLEASLKSTLLVRSHAGLSLTTAGAQFLESMREAEQAIEIAEQSSQGDQMAGTVRISAAEGFGSAILAPALPVFLRKFPHLRMELAASSGFLSPSRREVDMAITLSPATSPRLIVEPLTPYQLALYASPNHPAAQSPVESIKDLLQYDFVGYIDDMIYAPELSYLVEISPSIQPRMAISSIRAQRDVILSGGGIGILPCFLGEGLIRILPEKILIVRHFWMHTYREVHSAPRMKAVRLWLKTLCQEFSHKLSPFPS